MTDELREGLAQAFEAASIHTSLEAADLAIEYLRRHDGEVERLRTELARYVDSDGNALLVSKFKVAGVSINRGCKVSTAQLAVDRYVANHSMLDAKEQTNG